MAPVTANTASPAPSSTASAQAVVDHFFASHEPGDLLGALSLGLFDPLPLTVANHR
jgi:hypothetical protein